MSRALLLLLFLTVGFEALAQARDRTPFADAGEDGYTLVLWGDQHPDAELEKIFVRIRESGARHVTLPIFGCQSTIHSSDVGACEVGRASRAFTVELAKKTIAHGFHVSFLPIVVTPDWQWRGFFDPTDVDAWFSSYTRWIVGVAQLQTSLGIQSELIVGTEFTRLYQYEDQWKALLRELHSQTALPLVLTVNWGDTEHSFWSEADAIGVSAYYPLADHESPTQAELDQGWSKVHATLKAASDKFARPIHLTEIGYPSVTTAAQKPWDAAADAKEDQGLQARCFQAFRNAWAGDKSLVRMSVWATGEPGVDGESRGFEPIGKPAETVLRSIFASRAANAVVGR